MNYETKKNTQHLKTLAGGGFVTKKKKHSSLLGIIYLQPFVLLCSVPHRKPMSITLCNCAPCPCALAPFLALVSLAGEILLGLF
jgi:hypothetical protein